MPINVIRGDITKIETDVLVNAANAALSGGGGVDGAIHRAAGPGLLEECLGLGRCPPGEAVITSAYALPAEHVVHCVGPVWYGGHKDEDELLKSCHQRALELAKGAGAKRVTFPAISCGAYRFPIPRAAGIATRTAHSFLAANDVPTIVTFVCFQDVEYRAFSRAADDLAGA
jgi:O-acetyl-ADP-ribose deacetylase (regulator of RNase III)